MINSLKSASPKPLKIFVVTPDQGKAHVSIQPVGMGEQHWDFNINVCDPDIDPEPITAIMTVCLVSISSYNRFTKNATI